MKQLLDQRIGKQAGRGLGGLLLAGLVLAACSAGDPTTAKTTTSVTAASPTTTAVTPTGSSVAVAIGAQGFTPSEVSVREGDAVVFTNASAQETRIHFLNLGGDGAAYGPSIAPGSSWSYVAPGPRSILFEADGAPGRTGHIQVTLP